MKRLIGFFKKETVSLFRDPVLFIAIMVMPIVEMIVLSDAITLQARNLRLVVDAAPNDTLIERIHDHAIGSGWFIDVADSDLSVIQSVQSGAADVGLVAPVGGFTHGLVRGNGEIQILIDSMNIMQANNVESYLQGVIFNTLMTEYNYRPDNPIIFNTRILFNPELNTQFFMAPSLICVLLFIAIMMLIAISITKEKETGTLETLISAPISKYDIIIGKVVPPIVISFIIMVCISIAALVLFHVPFVGSVWMFLGGYLAFCVPVCAIAVLLSTYTHTQQQAMLGIIIVAFLALMLSGAMIPTENMPQLLQYISVLNPLSHYSYLVRSILLKGPDWVYFCRHVFIMLGVGILIWVIAIRRFKTKL